MAAFDHREMFETLIVSEGVRIRYKDESRAMRLLGGLFFNRMRFATTIGSTIYLQSRQWVEEDYQRAWRLLCHELVHVEDHKNSWLFGVKYLMPQGLAVFALLAIPLQSWWPLLSLAFLAPLPAPWRRTAEMRGYAMTMAMQFWMSGTGIPQLLKEHIALHFTGSNYYWAWPFKASTDREIGRWSRMVLCDEIFAHGEIYSRVHKMVKSRLS